jgi:hypothetical protein
MSGNVMEWAPFRVRPDVSEEELLEVAEALEEEFLARQPGYLGRDLLHVEGREWVDLVRWESAAAAELVVAAASQSPVCSRYFRLMEGADHMNPGDGVRHFVVERTFEPVRVGSS